METKIATKRQSQSQYLEYFNKFMKRLDEAMDRIDENPLILGNNGMDHPNAFNKIVL